MSIVAEIFLTHWGMEKLFTRRIVITNMIG
jgi:hypothetical protein